MAAMMCYRSVGVADEAAEGGVDLAYRWPKLPLHAKIANPAAALSSFTAVHPP